MKKLKSKILQILNENSTNEMSSTGTTGEIIIYAPFDEIVDDIIKIIEDKKKL